MPSSFGREGEGGEEKVEVPQTGHTMIMFVN